MDGERNGTQEAQQQEDGQQQAAQQPQQETKQEPNGAAVADAAAYEAQLAERDARIEELEGQPPRFAEDRAGGEAASGAGECKWNMTRSRSLCGGYADSRLQCN